MATRTNILAVALALLASGCSLLTVRGQSRPGACDCTTSTWAAGVDMVLAAGAVALARDSEDSAPPDTGRDVTTYVTRSSSLFLAISMAYGLGRTAQCRGFIRRETGRAPGGAFDFVYLPGLVGMELLRRDIDGIRRAADNFSW